tara:strand:- start:2280 stop:2885 length:606 start_codon:yes stop_codon:yes gene_type:complete
MKFKLLLLLLLSTHVYSMESWQEIKFKNVVKQKYDFSCGSASISTLLKLHDVHVTEIEILDFLKKDYQDIENIAETINNDNIEKIAKNNSLSMLDIKKVGEHYGFNVQALEFPYDVIDKLKHPAIVHLETPKGFHFSVLISKSDDFFKLLDPTQGDVLVTAKDFKKIYTGKLIIYEPKENPVLLQDLNPNMTLNSLRVHVF